MDLPASVGSYQFNCDLRSHNLTTSVGYDQFKSCWYRI